MTVLINANDLVAFNENSLVSIEALWSVLILEREENQSTRRKTLKAQERSTMRNVNSHESSTRGRRRPDLAWVFFSKVRGRTH